MRLISHVKVKGTITQNIGYEWQASGGIHQYIRVFIYRQIIPFSSSVKRACLIDKKRL